MELRLYILLLSLILTVKIVQVFGQTENCPTENDTISQGKCYTFFKQNLTWHEAKLACESSSMSLAEFENKDEASYVIQNMVDKYWFGIYDLNNEHTIYVWLSNNKTADIDYWYLVPSYGDNKCVYITWSNGPSADTTSCDVETFYICMSALQNNTASTTDTSSITTASTTETPSITTTYTTETPSITTTSTSETPSITTTSTTETPSITTTSTTETPSITTTSTTETPSITTTSTSETPSITTSSTTETPVITTSTTETPSITTTSTSKHPSITTSTTDRSFITSSVTETATYKQMTVTRLVFVFHCSQSTKLDANFSVLALLFFLLFI